ncbi:MAG: hypothetical protein KIG54_00220 [Bacteroidales bacterium]|nr:hypothetical protein [Bacteroidales bacterium]
MVLLTRGDADALPRADCFWAFSPRVNRNRTMPIPPENVIANTAVTSLCKNSGMHTLRPEGATCTQLYAKRSDTWG